MRPPITTLEGCAVVLALCMLPVPAHGQSVAASAAGVVSDTSGARLHGATVTITHVLNGRTLALTTGDQGDYRVVGLLPGDYQFSAERSGFSPVARRITLLVGADTTVDFTLEVAGVDTFLSVAAEMPLV